MFGILKSATNDGVDDDQLVGIFVAPLKILSNRVIFKSDTLSLKRLTSASKAQRWEIEAKILTQNPHFFVHNVFNDGNTKMYVRMPCHPKTFGQAEGGVNISGYEQVPLTTPTKYSNSDLAFSRGTGTATVASKNANQTTITLDPNSVLLFGDFIQFAGHDKVYAIAGVSGTATNGITITVFPNLQAGVAGGEAVKLGQNISMPAYYDVDRMTGIEYRDGIVADPGVIRMVEAT